MIIFLLMNSIVVISAFLLSFKIVRLDNFIDRIICLIIFYFAQIIVTELLLGALDLLYLKNISILNIFLFFGIWMISRIKGNTPLALNPKKIKADFLTGKIILFIIALILGFASTKILINLVNPPFGWDSLNYHFVFPVEWFKHGNLDNPITVSDDPSPPYYPINGSLFFLWLMLPLKNVFLADLGQVPFFALAFLAVYNISRKISLDRRLSFYAAALFLITPNFFKQLSYAYVDVMVAALFLVCVNFLFSLDGDFAWHNILAYSISLGLLLGTKTLALPYSILLFIPFVCLQVKNIKKTYLFLILAAACVILGGFTYIRNYIIAGNPLYPLELKMAGKTLLKGVMDSTVYSVHFNKIKDYSLTKLLFHEGMGLQTTLFILPAVFLALPAAFLKKRKGLNFNLAYFLILPILIYLAYRYIIPLANTRYLYPLLGVGVAMAFFTTKILKVPSAIVNVLTIICALASMPELAKRQELVFSITLTLLLFFSLPFLISRVKFITKPLFIVLFFIFLFFCLTLLEKNYQKNEYQRYIKMVKYSGFWPDATEAWNWLNLNTQGNNIAYIGRPVSFPLYGTNFKNNVYYVSVNKTEPARLHYFKNSSYRWGYDFLSLHNNLEAQGNYRYGADFFVWLDNLLRRGTDYLFIYSLHQTKELLFPLEDGWASANPARFNPVFTNQTVHIYKILR